MTVPFSPVELSQLIGQLVDGQLTDAGRARLVELLRNDPAARGYYLDYMDVHSRLERKHEPQNAGFRVPGAVADVGSTVELPNQRVLPPSALRPPLSAFPPILLNLSAAPGRSPLSLQSPVVSGLFSYVAAAVILGIGLLMGWTWRISRDRDLALVDSLAPHAPRVAPAEGPSVGRITGMVDCRWADPKSEVFSGDYVRLGQEFGLASGCLEVTYQSGAKVILQGPVVFVVESARGGFLSLGKLTALVEKKSSESEGERTASPIFSEKETQPTASLAPRPSALFSVRTPTAIVTDLGTEFGVEVDKSGATKSHVFQGKVELRSTNSRESTAPGGSANPLRILLGPNESAVVEAGQPARLIREAGRSDLSAFVRQMPRRVPIGAFGTGVGLRAGDPDPHWQLVARSDDPLFQPRPAVVALVTWQLRPNDPKRSQWLSVARDLPSLPDNVTYTFRTTFELGDVAAESVALRGAFAADNHVEAIRLNGVPAPVPAHGRQAPFEQLHPFVIDRGFRKGTNTLEVVVDNGAPGVRSSPVSPMALRVELYGAVLQGWKVSPRTSADTKRPTNDGNQEQKGGM
jgi:hypothetical protein